VKKLLKEYLVEFVALLVAILGGAFILIDRNAFQTGAKQAYHGVKGLFSQSLSFFDTSLASFTSKFTFFDVFGLVLIILVLVFIVWRVRYRFFNSEHWKATTCPKCGSEIHRIHRTSLDRFLSAIFLPFAARYQCTNSDCKWSGLRRRRSSKHRDASPERDQKFNFQNNG